ncbi:hypothetical protein PHJA_001384700 [Phtheirospermum japonicum]|uniref:Uncharacterized protein n=1 Tax=Phtheirospermum japonicum TaxID=374723 RepID=A0A830CB86_9LAMI|nr:hypothetical protein PHJA_001384700 [Phtheirospermum japonicum]
MEKIHIAHLHQFRGYYSVRRRRRQSTTTAPIVGASTLHPANDGRWAVVHNRLYLLVLGLMPNSHVKMRGHSL